MPGGLADNVFPNPLVTSFPTVNTFTIASFTMPGQWILTKAEREFGWQVQQGWGMSGWGLLPKGDAPVKATFQGRMWRTDQFQEFKFIHATLYAAAALAPAALSNAAIARQLGSAALGIDHPELKRLGVTSVVVLKSGAAMQEEGGLWIIELEFLEWRKPVQAPPRTKTVTSDIAPAVPTAQTAQQLELQQANAENAQLWSTLLTNPGRR